MILKKRVCLILLSVVMAFGFAVSTASAARANVTVQVDGKNVTFPDAKPYFEDSRVLIPVRFVSEALGAKVRYGKTTDSGIVTREVTIKLNDKQISMNINSTKVLVGEKIVTLDVPARLQQERTYVPLRFVSEALGASVDWNQAKQLVSITTESGAATPAPTVPDADNAFDWKPGYTDLAKLLFKGNVKVANGTLTVTIPKDTRAVYYSAKGKKTTLAPGKQYAYPIQKGEGFLLITKIYSGKSESEGYSIFLDGEAEGRSADQVVVRGNSGLGFIEGELSQVVSKVASL